MKKIESVPLEFDQNIKISGDSKDFISKCLQMDENNRLTWT